MAENPQKFRKKSREKRRGIFPKVMELLRKEKMYCEYWVKDLKIKTNALYAFLSFSRIVDKKQEIIIDF